MFQKRTTIVIGAGASQEVGLPIGSELKDKIKSILNITFDQFGMHHKSGSYEIYSVLRTIAQEKNEQNKINDYIKACWEIRDSMSQAISIDNYIDARKDNKLIELCGKIAIAEAILKAEKLSSLYIDPNNIYNKIDFDRIKNTWYNSFFQLITENCSAKSLQSRLSCITLVVFNYDRCIEQFLFHSLQNYYRISKEEAKILVNSINIYHPYGSLGKLKSLDDDGIDFGAEVNDLVLKKIYHEIKTFTEGTNPDSSEIVNIRDAIASCEILLFLGFSYQKQNLRLIKPINDEKYRDKITMCFGTSYGISESSTNRLFDELATFSNLSKERIYLNKSKCVDLFHEYWRDLSWDEND